VSDELVLVRIVGFPIELSRRAARSREAVRRELALIQFSDADIRATLPARLVEVAEAVRVLLSASEIVDLDEVQAAIQRGSAAVSFEARIPRASGAQLRELVELFAEADEFCTSGDLITLAMAPECRAFQEWFVDEIARQLDGGAPTPWGGAAT